MKTIFLIGLFFLNSCGFSSYYANRNNSDDKFRSSLAREQINLTRLQFHPKENCERIMKDELLLRMERLDENEDKDYRYILLIYPSYTVFPGVINFSGATFAMQIIFVVRYLIVDTKKINLNKVQDIPQVSFERLPAESIHGQMPNGLLNNSAAYIPNSVPPIDFTSKSKNSNEAREEYFERQALWLKENFTIVQEGQISDTDQYITSTILLYDDYISQQKTLQLVAKASAQRLIYNLIAIYTNYLHSDYNTRVSVAVDDRSDLDVLVSRMQNRIEPKIGEYLSIGFLRDKIIKLYNKKNPKPRNGIII